MLSSPSNDLQIAGVADDGSATGVSRSKLVKGQLVKVPFVTSRYATDNITGGATAVFNAGAGQTNPDGSGSVLVVTVPNNGSIRILQTFYGTTFGVRWVRGTADFAVVIDGQAFRVTSKLNEPETVTAITATAESENLTVVADDLTDGTHVAELVFTNSTGSTIVWNLWGYVLEQRAGHGGIPRAAGVANATTVPATDTAILDSAFRSFIEVYYYNTDTELHVVTIKQNSRVIDTIALEGLTGEKFALGAAVAVQGTASGTGQFSHIADTAGVINFMPVGGL